MKYNDINVMYNVSFFFFPTVLLEKKTQSLNTNTPPSATSDKQKKIKEPENMTKSTAEAGIENSLTNKQNKGNILLSLSYFDSHFAVKYKIIYGFKYQSIIILC